MTRCWQRCGLKLAIASWSIVGGAIASSGNCVLAQITPDGTLPNNSIVTPQGTKRVISGGTQAGNNLFHSFDKFSVPTGGAAYFNNALDIQNIISRVTGDSISNIDGLIQANDTANLFLLNPNGIIFGPNARLDIGGSFLGSTASSLNFADGTQFSATAPQTSPLLTVSVPTGLQYGGNRGSILNQSRWVNNGGGLQVQSGKTLALVGGDVRLDGGILEASGGRVELGGVAGGETVGLNLNGNDLRLSFPDGVERADVTLTGGGIYAYSLNSLITNNDGFEESVPVIPAVSIAINARNIDILEGSSLDASTFNGKAGEITLNATGAISSTGAAATDSLPSLPSILRADGTSGVINIKARSISLTDTVLTSTNFGGVAGSISLQADDAVSLANSSILSNIGYGKSAGEINIQATSVFITDSQVNAFGTYGISGNININASNSVSISSSSLNTFAVDRGRGGNIGIRAKSFSLNDGSQLDARTIGNATAGNIVVIADSVTLSGISSFGSSGLFTSTDGVSTSFGRSGQGGDIRIDAGTLHVSDGAVVSAITKSDGDGGNIIVNTNTLEVTGGGQLLTTAFSSGHAGDITVNAADSVTISDSDPTFADRFAQLPRNFDNDGPASGLFSRVQSDQAANAGNIKVTAGSIRLDNQGSLTTETTLGEGGNIILKAGDILLRHDSNITATAGTARAGGDAGNITIDTDLLAALENSDITANAFEGQGGNVQINTQGLFLSSDSNITASSERGINGVVEINTPDVDPSQGLATLPTELVEASGLIASSCAAVGENKFIITGRGGLPPNPRNPLNSNTVWVDWVTLYPGVENSSRLPVSTNPTAPEPAPIVEARGWAINDKGEVVLTANAPTTTPHSPWMTAADCHTPEASSWNSSG